MLAIDVRLTSIQRQLETYGRQMDVETASFSYWKIFSYASNRCSLMSIQRQFERYMDIRWTFCAFETFSYIIFSLQDPLGQQSNLCFL